MTITPEKFMENFTPEERARVSERAAQLIEEELVRRRAAKALRHSKKPIIAR